MEPKASLNEEAGFVESVSSDTLSYTHSDLYRYWMDTLRYGRETVVGANGQTATTGRYVVRTPEDIHAQFIADVHRLGAMPINGTLPVGTWKEETLLDIVRTSLGGAFPSWRERYLPFFELIVSQTIQATGWGFYTKKVAPFGYVVRQGTEDYKRLDIDATGAFRFVWAQNWAVHSLADIADEKEDNVLMVIPDVTTIQFIPEREGTAFTGFFRCESNFGGPMNSMIRIADNFLIELARRLPLPVSSMFGKPTTSKSAEYKICMSRIALRILPAVTQRRRISYLRFDESVLTALESLLHLEGYSYINGKRVPNQVAEFRHLEDGIIGRYGRAYTHSSHVAIPFLLRIKETIDYMKTAPECLTLDRFLKFAKNETTRGSNSTSIGTKSIATGPGFYKLRELYNPALDVLQALFTIAAKAGGRRPIRRPTRRSKKQKHASRRRRH